MAAVYIDELNQFVLWDNPDDGVQYCVAANSTGRIPRALQAWLDQGNSIDPYVAPDIQQLSRIQFKKHLRATGQLANARAAALLWANDSDARLEWDDEAWIRKDGAVMAALKADLGLTDQQITTFFNNAAVL